MWPGPGSTAERRPLQISRPSNEEWREGDDWPTMSEGLRQLARRRENLSEDGGALAEHVRPVAVAV